MSKTKLLDKAQALLSDLLDVMKKHNIDLVQISCSGERIDFIASREDADYDDDDDDEDEDEDDDAGTLVLSLSEIRPGCTACSSRSFNRGLQK